MSRFTFLKDYQETVVNIDMQKFFNENFPSNSINLPYIDKVKDIILKAFPYCCTEEEISEIIKRDKKTVQRIFISAFGIKYKQLIETLRIYCAIELLYKTSLDNSEIAFLLKYSELGNLDRDFNKVIGITPNKVRAEIKILGPSILFKRYYKYKNLL